MRSVLLALYATTVKGRSQPRAGKNHRRPLEDSGGREAAAGQEGGSRAWHVLGGAGRTRNLPEPVRVEPSSRSAHQLRSVRGLMPVWESCGACVAELLTLGTPGSERTWLQVTRSACSPARPRWPEGEKEVLRVREAKGRRAGDVDGHSCGCGWARHPGHAGQKGRLSPANTRGRDRCGTE